MNLELTQEQVDVLAYILRNLVGGDPNGPRKLVDEISNQLKPRNHFPCKAYTGIRYSQLDTHLHIAYLEKNDDPR